MRFSFASSTAFLRQAVVAGAVALSMGSVMVASTQPADAYYRHGYHRHYFGYRHTSGFHSCMHRSYGIRAVHFRRGC